ncbi:hypothetical protein L2E82_50024 [Cichorium intybus]|nr:hypothetical protein L2E82_50024 [Cichorium intybus]
MSVPSEWWEKFSIGQKRISNVARECRAIALHHDERTAYVSRLKAAAATTTNHLASIYAYISCFFLSYFPPITDRLSDSKRG